MTHANDYAEAMTLDPTLWFVIVVGTIIAVAWLLNRDRHRPR